MKKTLGLILVVFYFSPINAQIHKGADMIGGSINYYNSQNNRGTDAANSTNNFNITPMYGKAVRDNMIVGGQIIFGKNVAKQNMPNKSDYKSIVNSLGFGGFVRNYRNLGSSGFYLFIDNSLSFSFSGTKYKESAAESSTKNSNKSFMVSYGLYPGISYALNPNWQIETGLNNLVYASYERLNSNTSSFSAGVGIGKTTSLSVGLKCILGN